MIFSTPLNHGRRAAVLSTVWAFAAIGISPVQAHTTRESKQVDSRALAAAVNGSQRSEANRLRDGARHPQQTLEFFGLRPDWTVVEIAPGGGWYTEILAPYLHDKGRLFAAHEPADGSPGQRKARAAFADKLAQNPAVYGYTVLGTLPTTEGFTDIRPRGGADAVLTFRNIHNWIEDGHFDETLRTFYAVLKPGGILGVEEHRAAPGTSLARTIASGYVPEEFVIARAQAAGFVLVERSEINANPRDTKDYARGVWALPPTLRGGDADREKFLAIGESDRMTLRFAKPLH